IFNETGLPAREKEAAVRDAVRRHFRPEFVNRIDDVVVFHALSREHIHDIVGVQLNQLKKRLADRKLTLVLSEAAKDLLAERGYDPVYGARPLKREIQRLVLDPLAMEILNGRVPDGATVTAERDGDGLAFQVTAEADAAAAAA